MGSVPQLGANLNRFCFGWEGSPKSDNRKKGTLILTSIVEDRASLPLALEDHFPLVGTIPLSGEATQEILRSFFLCKTHGAHLGKST